MLTNSLMIKMIKNSEKLLIQVIPLLGKYTLQEIIDRLKLDCCPQTLSNWLRQNPPLRFPYHFTEYRCKMCKKPWRIWKIFYGRLHQPACPDCKEPCLQSWSIPMPEVFLQLGKNILWKGALTTLIGEPLRHFQQKLTDFNHPKYPLYLDQPRTKRQRRLHIIFKVGEGSWMTRCSRSYTNEKARLLNGQDPIFSTRRVCIDCLNNFLICQATPKDWAPIPLKCPQGRNYDDIELILDAWIFKNIKLACELRRLSPRAFYDAIERQPDLHYALFLRGEYH